MGNGTVNQFIDWGSQFHNPPWQANDQIAVQAGVTSVFDVMSLSGVTPALNVQSQGSGDSLFVTAINGVVADQGGNGYWWVYFVNGSVPDVGCAAYKVKSGDSIAWDYKHFSSGLKQAPHPELDSSKGS
ncbi:DUF4430 domain-containing protein [Bradyrhizobium sp.]